MARFQAEIVGAAMAQVLGYKKTFSHETGDTINIEYVGPRNGHPIKKGEFTPLVIVHNVTAYMSVREWAVTFYFRGRVLGEGPTVTAVGIKGWPSSPEAERFMVGKVEEALAMAAEKPQFGEREMHKALNLFRDKHKFLSNSPEYRQFPSKGGATKKIYASQTEV